MKQYNVKMVDGTRHEFTQNQIKRWMINEDYLVVEYPGDITLELATKHIVSILIRGDGDEVQV